ncbi:hypothetical protein CR194_09560 [Salipaludibacillus keqinensis]|uniref:Ribosomal protein L7/L12 C-terminal domain-containing protein n=1 Tax=Salipaludibacillus keqinensis TaxID=2045207 RepID=A0A323TV91_9BACI|nr:hypothetical protein [Salipaludibacillus keqinensis]PYZ93415.1 hypothetical protein CR194_09560 [Salipaludibacillus keqinensis]
MELLVLTILLVLVLYLMVKIDRLGGRIKSLNYTLDLVKKKLEVQELPVNDEIRKLLEDRKDVQAVKVARETLGLSLVEGREYVESLKHL